MSEDADVYHVGPSLRCGCLLLLLPPPASSRCFRLPPAACVEHTWAPASVCTFATACRRAAGLHMPRLCCLPPPLADVGPTCMPAFAPRCRHLQLPSPCRVPRRQVHSELRDNCLHRFRQLSGIPIEDQGVALLQASGAAGRLVLHVGV